MPAIPPLMTAALAAVSAGTALLPPPADRWAALAVIILLGIPHGALDGEVARPWLRPRFGAWWFAAFALPYLLLAGLVLWGWRLAPEPVLAGFLPLSVLHFGEEDAGPGRPLEAFSRGGLPIALLVLLHPAATADILGTVMGVSLPAVPGWLWAGALAWLVLLPGAVFVMHRQGRLHALLEISFLGLVFALLPTLSAFALYFVAIHAPRHMAALAAHPTRAPRVRSLRGAVWHGLPVTGLTLLLGAGLWPLYAGDPGQRLLALTVQGLAALTLPHLLLGWVDGHAGATSGRPGRALQATPSP